MNPSQALQLGLQLHQRGKLDQAESHYRAVLTARPTNFDALHLLGLLKFQQGRHIEALDLMHAALRLKPEAPVTLSNLGLVLAALGRLEEALASFDNALAINPRNAEAHNNRGNLLLHLTRFEEALECFNKALAIQPRNFEALNNRGKAFLALERPASARASFDEALALRRNDPEAHYNRGSALLRLKRPAPALASFDKALSLDPDLAEALNSRGNALLDLERPEEALASFDRAIAVKPDYAEALGNRGIALVELKRSEEALANFDRALAIKPDFAEVLYNRGNCLLELKRPEEALASFDNALAIKTDFADILYKRGNCLLELKRAEEALASFDKALAITPDHADAHNNRGSALLRLLRPAEALASFDRALAIKPDFAEVLYNRGNTLLSLKRPVEALASFDRALAINPAHADMLAIRGKTLLFDLNQAEEAVASFDKALAIQPDHVGAVGNRGNALLQLKRPEEALANFERALAINPDHPGVLGGQLYAVIRTCSWTRLKEITDRQIAQKAWRRSPIVAFPLFSCHDDPSVHLDCSRSFIQLMIPDRESGPAPLRNGPSRPGDRLRIAYMSADFRIHAVSALTCELFELHDRTRFEVLGVSTGVDDRSEMRSRLANSFDRFMDVRYRTDQDIADLLKELQVDIAVDLTTLTSDGRLGVLAKRPVPVQVSYLGYPGTTGAEFFDYVIADPIVLPFDQQPHYTERIVHLPDSYLVNDSKRAIPSGTPARQACGLPEDGFVFCCFSNNYKITREVFDVWMHLLAATPGSVLWLKRESADAERNLRHAANERGIEATRLVFVEMVQDYEQYLARYRQADLFLDTVPYNAHATASDALWVGLPLVTCMGRSFASRVAASVLHAAGLPELVTHSLTDYESLAMRLAADPALLNGYRQRLEENRRTCGLFDTARFARHIEAAYIKMWEIYQRGERPQSFSVATQI
jgi:protein O-GlcNAc transferase